MQNTTSISELFSNSTENSQNKNIPGNTKVCLEQRVQILEKVIYFLAGIFTAIILIKILKL